jgi:hypothetical protein
MNALLITQLNRSRARFNDLIGGSGPNGTDYLTRAMKPLSKEGKMRARAFIVNLDHIHPPEEII